VFTAEDVNLNPGRRLSARFKGQFRCGNLASQGASSYFVSLWDDRVLKIYRLRIDGEITTADVIGMMRKESYESRIHVQIEKFAKRN
jgi:hypothetical protein